MSNDFKTVVAVSFTKSIAQKVGDYPLNVRDRSSRCSNFASTVCKLGALQRYVDLQGAFVKIGEFKGFLVEFLENRRS